MKKYKILLVSFYNDEAYGMRLLHSILVNKGYDAQMLFVKINAKKTKFTYEEKSLFHYFLMSSEFDLVAFSLVSPNFVLYKQLYDTISCYKTFKILLGGWQASLNPQKCIPYCDYLCIGEGEEAVPELIDALYEDKDINYIKNIWINSDKVKRNPVRPLITRLEKYPFCLMDNKYSFYIENDKIIHEDPYTQNTRYGTMMGRGCPYHCTYCSNSYMSKEIYPLQWSRIRYRTVDHILNELKQAKEKLPHIKCINFYDEIFLPNDRLVSELFVRYRYEINLPFYCMFYPGTCNEDLAESMQKSGLAGVWLGIQSGSERVRKEIFKRYYTNEKIRQQVAIFKKYNVNVKYDFIFDNPFETEQETEESYKLMKELPEPKSFNFFSLKFFPNTEITRMALVNNLITQKQLDDQMNIECPEYEINDQRKKEILEKIK